MAAYDLNGHGRQEGPIRRLEDGLDRIGKEIDWARKAFDSNDYTDAMILKDLQIRYGVALEAYRAMI